MVLLEQAIPGALALQGVVWHIAGVAATWDRIKRFSWAAHLRSAMQGSPLGQFFLVASKEVQGRQGKSVSENMGDHW